VRNKFKAHTFTRNNNFLALPCISIFCCDM